MSIKPRRREWASVSHLFGACRPSAITRFVVSVVVDAVQAVSGTRLAAHVIKKGCVGMKPTVAYSDSTAAVVHPVFSGAVAAPPSHVFPCPVFDGPSVAMSLISLACAIGLKASAALSVACAQSITRDSNQASTEASAAPLDQSSTVSLFRCVHHRQATEDLSCDVDSLGAFHVARSLHVVEV